MYPTTETHPLCSPHKLDTCGRKIHSYSHIQYIMFMFTFMVRIWAYSWSITEPLRYIARYERLTPIEYMDEALGSISNVQDGDCIVCFSKAPIYQLCRQLEQLGRQCAVIYGSLPPGVYTCYQVLVSTIRYILLLLDTLCVQVLSAYVNSSLCISEVVGIWYLESYFGLVPTHTLLGSCFVK